jgi:hypothetical protein
MPKTYFVIVASLVLVVLTLEVTIFINSSQSNSKESNIFLLGYR